MTFFYYASAFILLVAASVYSFIIFSRSINRKWFDTPPQEGKFADSKGKKIFYRIKGKGGAVVIIINAIGSSQTEWWPIQDEIGKKCRIITFDRPGYGWSKSEDNSITPDSIKDEIDLILKFEKIRKSVFIVTNWTGAIYAVHYAKSNPEKVSGILLINPVPLRYAEWKEAVKNIDECPGPAESAIKKKKMAAAGLYRLSSPIKGYNPDKQYKRYIVEHYSRTANYDTMLEEIAQVEAALGEASAGESFPAIPVRILYPSGETVIRQWVKSGISEYSARQLHRVYEEMSKDIMDISPLVSSEEVPGSGEFIHISKPEAIVRELNQLITPKKESKKRISNRGKEAKGQ